MQDDPPFGSGKLWYACFTVVVCRCHLFTNTQTNELYLTLYFLASPLKSVTLMVSWRTAGKTLNTWMSLIAGGVTAVGCVCVCLLQLKMKCSQTQVKCRKWGVGSPSLHMCADLCGCARALADLQYMIDEEVHSWGCDASLRLCVCVSQMAFEWNAS